MRRELYPDIPRSQMSRSQVRTMFPSTTSADNNTSITHIERLKNPNQLYSSQINQRYPNMSPQEGKVQVRRKNFNFPVHISYSNTPISVQSCNAHQQSFHNETSSTMTNLHSKMQNTRSQIMMLSKKIQQMKKESTQLQPFKKMETSDKPHEEYNSKSKNFLNTENLSASFHEKQSQIIDRQATVTSQNLSNNYSPRLNNINESGLFKQSERTLKMHKSRDNIHESMFISNELKSSTLLVDQERKLLKNDYQQLEKSRKNFDKLKWKFQMDKSQHSLQLLNIASLKQRNKQFEEQKQTYVSKIRNMETYLNRKQIKNLENQSIIAKLNSQKNNQVNISKFASISKDEREQINKQKQKLNFEASKNQMRSKQCDAQQKKLENQKKQVLRKLSDLQMKQKESYHFQKEYQRKKEEFRQFQQKFQYKINQEAIRRRQSDQIQSNFRIQIQLLTTQKKKMGEQIDQISKQKQQISSLFNSQKYEYENILSLKTNVENELKLQKQQFIREFKALEQLRIQKEEYIGITNNMKLQIQGLKNQIFSEQQSLKKSQVVKNDMLIEIQAIRTQVQNLVIQKSQYEKKFAQQVGSKKLANAEAETTMTKIQELHSQKSYLQQQLRDAKILLESTAHQRNILKKENQNNQREIHSQIKELQTHRKHHVQLSAQIELLTSDINRLNEQKHNNNQQLNNKLSAENKSSDQLIQLQNLLNESKNMQTNLEEQNKGLENKIAKISIELALLSKQNMKYFDEIQFLKGNLTAANDQNFKLQALNEQNREKLLKMKKNEEMEKQFQNIQRQNIQKKNKISILQRQIATKATQINKGKAGILKNGDQIKKLIRNFNKTLQQLKSVSLKYKHLEESLTRASQDKQALIQMFTSILSEFMSLLIKTHSMNRKDYELMVEYRKQLRQKNITLPSIDPAIEDTWLNHLLEILKQNFKKRLQFEVKMDEEIIEQKIDKVFQKLDRCTLELAKFRTIKG